MIRAATKLLLGLSTHHLDIVWLSQINKCWHLEKNPSSGFTFKLSWPCECRRDAGDLEEKLFKDAVVPFKGPVWKTKLPLVVREHTADGVSPQPAGVPHDLISFLWCRDEPESNYCSLKMLRTGPLNIINKCVHLLLTLKSQILPVLLLTPS